MPGILYVVATPIGNLEDVTFRAIRVLREVAVIAAEDTRRTARLLQHYSISTPTTSLHEHNERARTPSLISRLARGESVALVSDAGTPVVSDPGAVLVAAAHAAGIRVEPVPGPSAALAAVSASGLQAEQVLFVGFPPSRSVARKRWLEKLRDESRVIVFFEAPHRIRATLADLLAIFGDRVVAIGRELTKAYEELVVRPISLHLEHLTQPKGEFTLVVSPAHLDLGTRAELPAVDALVLEFGELTKNAARTRRETVKVLAERYGISARDMYRLLESGKQD
jgi:16S rRNA (cytidine1402-2'-O)-methyltransferase